MSGEKRSKDEDDDDDDDQHEPTRSNRNQVDDSDEMETKSDDDTDSNASSEYEVEKILAKRRRRRGGFEYYIKWVGYDDSANEWIPETSLNCPTRVAEFERGEKKTRKARDSRRRPQSGRNSHRAKRRRVKIIDDYDDDDDDDQGEVTKSVASTTSSSNKSATSEKTTSSVQYGVEKGYKVQAVLGINRTKSEQLHYLVHYQSPTSFDDNMELIPADVAKRFCEDEIIQFYETRITWNDRRNE